MSAGSKTFRAAFDRYRSLTESTCTTAGTRSKRPRITNTTCCDALAQLLGVGPCFVDYEGLLPVATIDLSLHERIIRLLESATWRELKDRRLLRIEAQAYETWWSLSVAAENDPELEQNGLRPAKFATGSQRARIKALRLYSLAATNRTDPEQLSRLVKLRTRHDTNQRAGFCGGD